MSSIYDLPRVSQPYPDQRPWFDLSSFVVNDWAAGSGNFVFWASLEGNLAHIYLRTRRGTDRPITETLPDELIPPGQRVFDSFCAAEGSIGLLMQTTGECLIYAPGRTYTDLIDGTLGNFVVESSYVRRAV